MIKVGIAELKARLSEHLRSVRKGRRITVVDRSTPIAELVPIQQDIPEIRPASRSARNLPLGKPVLPPGTSSLAVLLEDRSKR
jgi:prevent-host-death family protein